MSEEELSRVAVGMGTELSEAEGAVEGAIGDAVCEGDDEKNDLGIDLTGLRRDDGDNKTEAGCCVPAI
jgi:outer membrane lipoprotein SlyB